MIIIFIILVLFLSLHFYLPRVITEVKNPLILLLKKEKKEIVLVQLYLLEKQ